MRLNYETCLVGEKVILVPYRPEHVDKYHEWMKSPFLLEMTGSEPLSLEEEVKMQQSWRDDDDKCTFILLAKESVKDKGILLGGDNDGASSSLESGFITKSLDAMVGDVNLFLSDEDAEEEDNDGDGSEAPSLKQAELDIMVADDGYRRQGVGKEAVCTMMLFGAQQLGITRFVAKIKEENMASRNLFQNKLGFRENNYVACFQEYEYVFEHDTATVTASAIKELYDVKVNSFNLPVL